MPFAMDHQSRVDRFWRKVKRDGPDECWEWQGSLWYGRDAGYGKVLWAAKPKKWWRRAHKIVWELERGLITDPKLCVCHSCDNRRCCNPAHLWLGTRRDNNLDKQRKGRDYDKRGIKNPRAKLSEDNVREIRALLADGVTQDDLAAQFGVAQVQIWRIKEGITWKHVK